MIDRPSSSTPPVTPKPAPPKPKPAPVAKPAAPEAKPAAPAAKAAPAPAAKPAPATPARGSTSQLERGKGATSNPAAASAVTERQSATAKKLTGQDQPSAFDLLAGQKPELGGGILDTLRKGAERSAKQHDVAEKAQDVARDDAAPKKTPKGFADGDKIAAPPNLGKEKPVREEKLPDGGKQETFKVDDQTYTRITKENGTATTSYEQDGVSHRATEYADGRSAHKIETGKEGDQHTRVVERDIAGKVARESYNYEGAKGTLTRETEHSPNGASTTQTDRTYKVDATVENLTDAPSVPGHAKDIVALPSEGRGPTQVHESEVVSKAANGKGKVQSRESAFTQSSTDVSSDLSGASVSRTVTNSEKRDEDGKLAKTSSASQSITAESDRGGKTRLTDTWHSDGRTSQNYSRSKLTEDDLSDVRDNAKEKDTGEGKSAPTVTIGGQKVKLAPPGGSMGLKRERAGDWLEDVDNRTTQDLDVTVSKDAKGKTLGKETTFSTLDEKGNGRTVTRTAVAGAKGKDAVQWAYTKFGNDGKDYDRQTGYENSTITTFDRHRDLGGGQFKHTSESKDGKNVIAKSSAERLEMKTLDEVRARVSPSQAKHLETAGPPYIVESTSSSTELWKDEDGKVHKDEKTGKPLQGQSSATTLTVSNKKGYAVTENLQSVTNEDGSRSSASLSAVADPASDTPYRAVTEKSSTAENSCEMKVDERSQITIDRKGQIQVDGKDAARLNNLGKADFNAMMASDPAVGETALNVLTHVNSSSGTADGLARAGKDLIDARYNELGFDAPNYSRLTKLNGAAGVFGLATGAKDIFQGISEGGVDGVMKAVGGAGGIAGGLEGAAIAAAALPGRAGSFASAASGALSAGTAAKFLGRASGIASIATGGYDLITGDSTQKKVAGGLTAASGGLLIAGAASTGTIVGAPAGVVLAGAGVVVGAAGIVVGLFAPDEDDESPAPKLDSRLGES